MNKTINIGEGQNNVEIHQTIAKPDTGPSVGGVSLTTGYGWGVDVSIIQYNNPEDRGGEHAVSLLSREC